MLCRRDSFITHVGFCDALGGKTAKKNTALVPSSADEDPKIQTVMPSPPPQEVAAPSQPPVAPPPQASSPSATAVASSVLPLQNLGTFDQKLDCCSFRFRFCPRCISSANQNKPKLFLGDICFYLHIVLDYLICDLNCKN